MPKPAPARSEWSDTLLEMREFTTRMRCECYDPDEMEFHPDWLCPRCELLVMIDDLLGQSRA
jgi:hypothetical protein